MYVLTTKSTYYSNQYSNMNGLIGVISLSALLLTVSGQLSALSSSYSLQGRITRRIDGIPILAGPYSVSVDISRQLQFVDESLIPIKGDVSNNLRLSSADDSATYRSVNGVCSETAFNPNIIFPLNTNVWNLYANGTESPTGTYSFTQDDITYQVTIINDIPASFTFCFDTTIIGIAVSNFNNTTPAFSTFSLPTECSQFTCDACYNSAVSVSISVLLLLTTLLLYLFSTH